MSRLLTDDPSCDKCNAEPRRLKCSSCGIEGNVTDCGHKSQPRPISPDDDGDPICEDCCDFDPCPRCGVEHDSLGGCPETPAQRQRRIRDERDAHGDALRDERKDEEAER